MSRNTSKDAAPDASAEPELSGPALSEWNHTVENVMRGIAHALNNRAAALSAVLELSRDSTDDATSLSSILRPELQRVQDLAKVVRTIGFPRAGMEAFAPGDAAEEAIEVLRMSAELRDRTITIDALRASPTRVPRWMYVRSLVALGAAGARATRDATTLRIAVADDGDWVAARVQGVSAQSAAPSAYVSEMCRAMGGATLDTDFGFRVPTLAALRRREGR